MAAIPFPLTSVPGSNPQESEGRLINCFAEPIGEAKDSKFKWIRSAGLSQFAVTMNTGYRGGLTVNNTLFECWLNNASTIDPAGAVTSLGTFPGSRPVSIARNQAANPDVVAVDLDNGAYVLGGASFSGTPTFYNASNILPEPNSICFQDGYFFFTIGSGQIYATALNSLAMNALTYITVQSKADVFLLRGIAFSGVLLAFTTGSCEVWQDAANTSPNFPYSRLAVLEFGLAQPTAIAGWETGFSELLWVAQDFGVHWMSAGQLAQVKVSPPDLDRLIEKEIRAGNQLWAGVYITSGKKFWTLSSSSWTWEFNILTRKWTERQSLKATGVYGAARGQGGHPGFSKWLQGDGQSGNLLWVDDTNPTENGTPMLDRIESGPMKAFPAQTRALRADFDFVVGVGMAQGNVTTTVLGTAAAPVTAAVRLQVVSTTRMNTGDVVSVAGVTGTTEANGTWSIVVVDGTHLDLETSVYAHAWAGAGVVTDLTATQNQQNPQVAISMSKDGGLNWGNPLVRPLGSQANALRSRVSVTRLGLSGTMGVRFRLDVTDQVYASFLGATMYAETRFMAQVRSREV